MAKYTIEDIQKLRQATGARVLDCKKALQEAEGDFEKAQQIVSEKGLARAEKKADRNVSQGYIASYVHTTGKIATMVEVLCETDFVAKNEEFQTMARDIAMHISAMNPATVEELLEQDFVKDSDQTIEKLVKSLSGKIGERMVVSRFVRFEIGQESEVVSALENQAE
ncbi:MAG: translation elongation factor Ts [Candidatus Pacebacteria bacterium]|nr:translation elongation factor Ts [Candidatus Paceibacterota bacterium]